ncbi:hypothetical protein [Bradyrhizobium sp. USDA 4452]
MRLTLAHLLAVSDLLTAAESAVSTGILPPRRYRALVLAIENAKRTFNNGSADAAVPMEVGND